MGPVGLEASKPLQPAQCPIRSSTSVWQALEICHRSAGHGLQGAKSKRLTSAEHMKPHEASSKHETKERLTSALVFCQGSAINLVGMGATLLGLQATVGLLVAKTLTNATANPFLSGGQGAYNPVLALDVFLVQVKTGNELWSGACLCCLQTTCKPVHGSLPALLCFMQAFALVHHSQGSGTAAGSPAQYLLTESGDPRLQNTDKTRV